MIFIKHSIKNTTDIKTSKKSPTRRNLFQIFLFLLIMLISWTSSLFIEAKAASTYKNTTLQQRISKKIIRFHVIANSDTDEDQALKLKVKDSLVAFLSPQLKSASDIDVAREIIKDNLKEIKQVAETVIHENGYNYGVTVSLEHCFFPLKVYDDYNFPPGTYEALRVKIGEANGHNWWCVMFPPLCFVDETYSIVDKETDKKLKYLLSDEDYNSLKNKKVPVKIKFKIWESAKKLMKLD